MSFYTYFVCLLKKKLVLKFVLVFLAATISYIICHRISVMPDIHSHHGDGQFENISRQLGLFAIPGYRIKMPKFDLNKPKQAEYRLSKLQKIGRRCAVYLAVNTDYVNWEKNLQKNIHAKLQLELRDSSGQILINLHGNLSDYTAYSSTRMDFIALYLRNQNISFFPESCENYIVSISYSPDLKLKDYQGFVYFECGGSK